MELNSADLNFSAEFPFESTNIQQSSNPGSKSFEHNDSDDENDILDDIMPLVSYLDLGTPRMNQNIPLVYNSSTPKSSLSKNIGDLARQKDMKLPEFDSKAHDSSKEIFNDNVSNSIMKRKNSLGPIESIISFPDEFGNENISYNLDDLPSIDSMDDFFSQPITTSTPKASLSNLEENYDLNSCSPIKHSNLKYNHKYNSEASQLTEFSSGFSSYFARAVNRLKRNSDLIEKEPLFEDVDKLLCSLEKNCPDSAGIKRRRSYLASQNIAHIPVSASSPVVYDDNIAVNIQPSPSVKSYFPSIAHSLLKVTEHNPKVRDNIRKPLNLKSPTVISHTKM